MGLEPYEGWQDLIQNKDRTAPLFSRKALASGDSYLPGGGFEDDELKDSIEYASIIVSFEVMMIILLYELPLTREVDICLDRRPSFAGVFHSYLG